MNELEMYEQFLAVHKPQLESSGVPQHLWPSLYRKVNTDTFDAGVVFQLMLIDYDDEDDDGNGDGDGNAAKDCRPVFALCVAADGGLQAADPEAIYLVDHAWTFRLAMARGQLEEHERLTERICAITGVDLEDDQRVDKVLARMWRYVQCYSVSMGSGEALSDEARSPIWYIMDEVGSAISHSDEPNFRLVPFLNLHNQTTYSLLFPVRDCESGDTVTRDFVEYVPKESPERAAFLLPWRPADLSAHSIVQTEPEAEYFTSGHIAESYPQQQDIDALALPQVNRNEPLKVYAEYDVLRQHLNSPEFQLVDDAGDADVLWLTQHYKTFEELNRDTPNKFVNQFPFEYVITIKDLLSITCRRTATEHSNASTLETFPAWLPTTYNLKTELLAFVSYYQQRAAKGLDNHWIIKPWNLARSLDTHITADLAQIMRLPVTGPKIAQKYIERPVLFYRPELDAKVKFDIRYVILLKSVRPLEAYVHRKFFLRFANRAFALERFDEYERHFTVMNYHEEAQLRHIKCEEFLDLWHQQYPHNQWSAVEDDICTMLHEMLICATERAQPPCAIAACPQSRALYAADIMLEWCHDEKQQVLQPKLLEVNWTPDCKRACDYYEDFFNDIFKLLFLDVNNDESFRLLQAKSDSAQLK